MLIRKKRIIVSRKGRLGDMAILLPVVKHRAAVCKDYTFVVVGPKMTRPLYQDIENVEYVVYTSKRLRFFLGQMRKRPLMFLDMRWNPKDVLYNLFRLCGVKTGHIRFDGDIPFWKRYNDVFDSMGLSKTPALFEESQQYWTPKKHDDDARIIGIAPSASSQIKEWPMERVKELLALLADKPRWKVYLFGGVKDMDALTECAKDFDNVESLAGQLDFGEELKVIRSLDVMVSMDSGNAHFASALGTPVVSIWGATSPSEGYYGWRQNPDWAVVTRQECAPCSLFGENVCKHGDHRCFWSISAQQVMDKIDQVICHPGRECEQQQ